jgi:hypothetical protein
MSLCGRAHKTSLELKNDHVHETPWIQTAETSIGDAERTYLFDGVPPCSALVRSVYELAGVPSLMDGAKKGVNVRVLHRRLQGAVKLFGLLMDSDHRDRIFADQARQEQGPRSILCFFLPVYQMMYVLVDTTNLSLSPVDVYPFVVRSFYTNTTTRRRSC